MTYTVTACDAATQKQTKQYKWIEPSTCVQGAYVLPEDEVVSCVVPTSCEPGMAPVDGVCTPCASGTVSENGTQCHECVPGHQPTAVALHYTTWESLPDGFSTSCKGQCATDGWRPATAFIDSGSSLGIGTSTLSWEVAVCATPPHSHTAAACAVL